MTPTAPQQAIRVLLVDDHPVVRMGLAALLSSAPNVTVVGEAADGAQAVALTRSTEVDVVLMDLRMPVMDGVAATAAICRATHPPRVVVLTTYDTDADILRAVEAGATGSLLKDTPHEELVAGVLAAARGQTVLAPTVATRLVTSMRTERLTGREADVLRLVAQGLPNAGIGRELHITEATVKTYLLRAFAKLGVDDRTHAVTVARDRGFL